MIIDESLTDDEHAGEAHVTPDQLWNGLRSLFLLDSDVYLRMQAVNLGIVDGFIMELEAEDLRRRADEEAGSFSLSALLSAQTQMWIYAAYELLRTWRQRVKEAIDLKEKGGLDARIAELDIDLGFEHLARKMRAAQLRNVRDDSQAAKRLQDDLLRVHMVFRRIDHLRISLAKHEVKGGKGAPASSPGSSYPDPSTGSLRFEIGDGRDVFCLVSRREIADGLRALRELRVPAEEEIESFNMMMKGPPKPGAISGTRG